MAPVASGARPQPGHDVAANLRTGVTAERTREGTLIRFDTDHPEARKALMASLAMLGPQGRELKQAEAGLRMALEQRRGALASRFMRDQQVRAARRMVRSATQRLRLARLAMGA